MNQMKRDADGVVSAIVLGAGGRVGSAFSRRLQAAGFRVSTDPAEPHIVATRSNAYLFDCAYQDGDPAGHIMRVAAHLTHWRDYAGIFVPSSSWIGEDHAYGHAKRVVEALAAFYRTLGANVVTDRIGYFPGDGVPPDPAVLAFAETYEGKRADLRSVAAE